MQDDFWVRLLSVLVFSIAAITDFLDGYLARLYKVNSSFGSFIDPLADKILTFTGFISLSILRPDLFPWIAVFLIIGRDVLTTVMRMIASRKNMEMKTSYSAKVKTFAQLVFLYIALLSFTFVSMESAGGWIVPHLFESGMLTWAFYGITAFTVYTGIEYIIENKALFSFGKTSSA